MEEDKTVKVITPIIDRLLLAAHLGEKIPEHRKYLLRKPPSLIGLAAYLRTVSDPLAVFQEVDLDYITEKYMPRVVDVLIFASQLPFDCAQYYLKKERHFLEKTFDDDDYSSNWHRKYFRLAPMPLLLDEFISQFIAEDQGDFLFEIFRRTPASGSVIFRDNKLRKEMCHTDALCEFIQIFPSYIPLVLMDHYFDDVINKKFVAEIIRFYPHFLRLLFLEGHVNRVLFDEKKLKYFIELFPDTAPVLLQFFEARKLIQSWEILFKIVKAAPACASVVLADGRLRQLCAEDDEDFQKVICFFSERVSRPEALLDKSILDLIENDGYETFVKVLGLFSWSSEILLSVKRLRDLIKTPKQLIKVVQIAPKCALSLLEDKQLYELVVETWNNNGNIAKQYPQLSEAILKKIREEKLSEDNIIFPFMWAAPESAPSLLEDQRIRVTLECVYGKEDRTLDRFGGLCSLLCEIRNWSLVMRLYLGQWPELKISADVIWEKIVEEEPESLSVFLLNEDLRRALISGQYEFEWVLDHYSKGIPLLLADPFLWERILLLEPGRWESDTRLDFLLKFMGKCPSYVLPLLADPRFHALVSKFGRRVKEVVRCFPQAAELFMKATALRPFSFEWLQRDKSKGRYVGAFEVVRYVKFYPELAAEIISYRGVSELLGSASTGAEDLRKIICAAPTVIPLLFSLLAEDEVNKKLGESSQKDIVRILIAAPQMISVLYPRCFLLFKPHYCALVMSLVSLHEEFDDTAPLPCVSGGVNWALYLRPLTNEWLNQLMQSLAQLESARAPLTQGYLLFYYARRTKNGMEMDKSVYDAIMVLAGVAYRSPQLSTIVKYLFLEIRDFLTLLLPELLQASKAKSLENLSRIENYFGGFERIFSTAHSFRIRAPRVVIEAIPPSLFFRQSKPKAKKNPHDYFATRCSNKGMSLNYRN